MLKKIFIITIPFIVLIIYLLFPNNKLNYTSLGDSITLGENPYSNIDYSYSDYVYNYLKKNNKLNKYTKTLIKKTYTINELKNDIELNKIVISNNKKIGIKRLLRESNIITFSIGQNDIDNELKYLTTTNIAIINNKLDEVINKLNTLITTIKLYNKNTIILVGCYNIKLYHLSTEDNIKLINYINKKINKISIKNKINYVYIDASSKIDYFPNPQSIYPNYKAHNNLSTDIIEIINKKTC